MLLYEGPPIEKELHRAMMRTTQENGPVNGGLTKDI